MKYILMIHPASRGGRAQLALAGSSCFDCSDVLIDEDGLPSGSTAIKLAGPVVLWSASLTICTPRAFSVAAL